MENKLRFSEDPRFSDLVRIAQDDGPNPVVPIAYSEEFVEVMDYFRAVLKLDEKSKRAIDISSRAIQLNSGNYTAWHFRLDCIRSLKLSSEELREELKFIESIAEESSKNYQLWHHRKCIIQLLGNEIDPKAELSYLEVVLQEDEKNYHVWGYRQWVISHFGCWDQERTYTAQILRNDYRNNSAWNQRYWVLQNLDELKNRAVIQEELTFVFQVLALAPGNESPYNYLRGLLKFMDNEQVESTINYLQEFRKTYPRSIHLLAFIADTLVEKFPTEKNIEDAKNIYSNLETLDSVRQKYWRYLSSSIPNNSS